MYRRSIASTIMIVITTNPETTVKTALVWFNLIISIKSDLILRKIYGCNQGCESGSGWKRQIFVEAEPGSGDRVPLPL